MTHLSLIVFARRIALQANPVRVVRGLVAVLIALACGAALAQTAGTDRSFDHASTGFSLNNQHVSARCESCHVQGIFRGTPRDCSTCHRNASRPAATQFPIQHIPTTQQCDICHKSVDWKLVIFRHQGVTRGTCLTCHNGSFVAQDAVGKPALHVVTIGSCDTCHNTLVWTATTYNHAGVPPGTCIDCHRGRPYATGKTPTLIHQSTIASCDFCHDTAFWKPARNFHDATAAGRCSTCHNGVQATGKNARHIPTNAQCDTCHIGTATFTAWVMNHTGVTQCSTCHNGSYAMGKTAGHVVTTAQCDTCHSTTAWKPANYTHPANVAGTCATCHNGVTALGKNTGHIPTNAQCDSCHTNTTTFFGAAMNHTGMAGQCSNCHNGNPSYLAQNAQAKSSTHVATAAQCDSSGCHASTTSWATTTTNHALYSPPVVVGDHTCANCHKSGGSGLPKPGTHIPTTGACDTCHANFTAFKPAFMDHTGTTGQCSSCHNGSYVAIGTQGALAKPVLHIPVTAQCDSCHTSFIAFKPAAMNHGVVGTTCSTCHSGSYVAVGALGKPATHVTTSAQCGSCHTTAAWTPATYVHDSTAALRCSVCHNGITALGKGTTHIPDFRQCDTCHTSTSSFLIRSMNHSGLTGQCSTCHSGSYVSENAQTKSASHQTTTAQCDTCHTSTTTWATAIFDHALNTPPVVIGDHTCATCHVAGHTPAGLPKPSNHIPTTAACDTCHTNFIAFKPAFMNHTGTTGACTTCHNGSYVAVGTQGALSKPGTHIPTSAQCDSCHTNYISFKPASMNHTGTAGACSTCHNGAYISVGTQGALAKPSTHIVTAAQCDTCHTTSAWKPATYTHDASATGQCSTCHNNVIVPGKSAAHIPDTRQCDVCHTSTTSFLVATMNHSGLAGKCSTCHNGNYLAYNAQAKSSSHVNTALQCDSSGCHTSTTTWAGATYNHSGVTIGGHTCANAGCHISGGTGLPKPTNHIPTTQACDLCHKNFVAFNPATMDHTGTTGVCLTCHNGSYLPANAQAKPVNHIPATQSCDICHRTTAWMPLLTPYSHTGIAAGTCTNCHSSGYANIDVKPAGHIPTSLSCDQCHRATAVTWLPVITPYSHTGIAAGSCTTCHTAPYTDIKLMDSNHIPTVAVSTKWASCDACHKSYSTFTGVRLHSTVFTSNSQYPGTCTRCHEYGNPYGLQGRTPSKHTTTARKAPNSCDNSGCHSVKGF